ncbi:AAA domain-containing protein [Podospora aff. communis PSN243]|uniref:AAA domain-containing protein n=1 Tax=Podospora aff. communis PSN243 TaxID=3040156 RepID=A0AAV9G5I5_9PEZI|nr:AAA domain-containing protein [Podospora aff. communis PSN243]
MPHQNIYIVGAQCTGKTTIVNALDAHFKDHAPPEDLPAIIKEVARTVLVEHDFTASDITSSAERCLALQGLILQAQLSEERKALSSGAKWFISDRSGIDPIAYALQYVGKDGAEGLMRGQEWTELKQRMKGSLIVVCEAGVDWLRDDGVRLMPESVDEWKEFNELFCGLLRQEGLEHVVLSRTVLDRAERLRFVLTQVE